MKIVGMIPVRMESTRLPNKAIRDICGLPMIIHTMKRTMMAKELDEVYVVTDSTEIKELVESHGGKIIITSSHHQTGSDRLAEAASKIEANIIVNVQGDEALVNPVHIDQSIQGLINSDAQVSLLLTKFSKRNSSGDIKAVVNLKNEIMYLSRNDLPSDSRVEVSSMLKAYHVVSFRKDFLIKYADLGQTPLEKIEYNEYLRILENGYKIQGVMVDSDSISVDTKEDLSQVTKAMGNDAIYRHYKI
ncbi:MAG TPA: 3-deoxy-manno-octulosonate cytidylyltransferase [Sulfurovum sp.]|nr:3-deoxy-manno-octulosonate cytidylyltransferase [Sulfurovum sp.]